MKMLITRIVITAKSDETTPAPIDTSAPAASPSRLTSVSAALSSFVVMSYFWFASRRVGFRSKASLRSWAY
jgi:hypothetical protein